MWGVHSSSVWHLPPIAPSLLARQEESKQSSLFLLCFESFFAFWNVLIHFQKLKTTFQVFVSLRQNDQELASMYDQVRLNSPETFCRKYFILGFTFFLIICRITWTTTKALWWARWLWQAWRRGTKFRWNQNVYKSNSLKENLSNSLNILKENYWK